MCSPTIYVSDLLYGLGHRPDRQGETPHPSGVRGPHTRSLSGEIRRMISRDMTGGRMISQPSEDSAPSDQRAWIREDHERRHEWERGPMSRDPRRMHLCTPDGTELEICDNIIVSKSGKEEQGNMTRRDMAQQMNIMFHRSSAQITYSDWDELPDGAPSQGEPSEEREYYTAPVEYDPDLEVIDRPRRIRL